MKHALVILSLALAPGFLGACADLPATSEPHVVERIDYGIVESIDLYRAGSNQPTGLGAVLGGIAGGVIGHQIGSGRGNDLATVAGTIGGAVVGNAIEKSKQGDRYRVTVVRDDGARIVLEAMGEGELRIGDRVRIVNGRAHRT